MSVEILEPDGLMCGQYQPSGLDIHGEPTTTGARCSLPWDHSEPWRHMMETPGDAVRWSTR